MTTYVQRVTSDVTVEPDVVADLQSTSDGRWAELERMRHALRREEQIRVRNCAEDHDD